MTESFHTLVTIIIPVYNSESFLIKCLNSIIQQTYQHLEIILINDGSTDTSPEIINEYAAKDNRIVTIHKENGGIGSAYKAAFEVMTGDYVLFVDSDDWLEFNAVENLVKLALNNEADFVSFGIRAFNITGGEIGLPSFKNIDLINTTNEAILKTHFEVLKHPTLVRLYKKELFEDIVVFEQNIGIDEMLTPQLLAKCNRAVYTSEVYYNVLIRQDSVCRSKYSEKKVLELIKAYQFVIRFMEKYISDYPEIAHFKYLNSLFDILHQKSLGNVVLDHNTVVLLMEDLKYYHNKLKRRTIYRRINFRSRLAIFILLQAPSLYQFVLYSYKKVNLF